MVILTKLFLQCSFSIYPAGIYYAGSEPPCGLILATLYKGLYLPAGITATRRNSAATDHKSVFILPALVVHRHITAKDTE